MVNVFKVIFMIIGTIVGAGLASRERNIFVFWYKWLERYYRNYF